jgi:hypothetical protein
MEPPEYFIGFPSFVRRLASTWSRTDSLVRLRDAEQHADRSHRHLGAEIRDEVERPGVNERAEAAGVELADRGLQRRDLPRREYPRQETPVYGVYGWALEDQRA